MTSSRRDLPCFILYVLSTDLIWGNVLFAKTATTSFSLVCVRSSAPPILKPQKTHPKPLGRDPQLVRLLLRVPACSESSIQLYTEVRHPRSAHDSREILLASGCGRRAGGEGEGGEERAAFG